MAVGIQNRAGTTHADDMLDNFIGGMGATKAIQLHTGDPGIGALSSIGNSGRRQLITFAAAAGGVKSNSAAITWLNVIGPGTEDYTHWSLWTSATAGAGFVWASGTMTANAIAVGNDFTIPIGGLDLTCPIMA